MVETVVVWSLFGVFIAGVIALAVYALRHPVPPDDRDAFLDEIW